MVFITAEIGINHNGDVKIAEELIKFAKLYGCDAVKFQTFKQNSRISSQVKSVKYSETVIGLEETLDDMFNRLAMPFDEQKELFKDLLDILVRKGLISSEEQIELQSHLY